MDERLILGQERLKPICQRKRSRLSERGEGVSHLRREEGSRQDTKCVCVCLSVAFW